MPTETPFQRDFGTRQGRIDNPQGVVPPEGSFVFVLGYDLPLHTEILGVNDYIEISQLGEFAANTKILRMRVRLRAPVVMPTGVKWILILYIDGIERTRRTLRAGSLRDLYDLAANVTGYGPGEHLVVLRLQLVTE